MLTRTRYPHVRYALAIAALVLMPATARVTASTRQVSVESLIYDLKSPDAVRRQAAAKELGAVKYRPAIPQLVPLARDPIAAVRREVELALENMDDAQTLPGFIALSSDTETDIRSRALASLVNLHVAHAFGMSATLMNLRERVIFGADRDLEIVVEPDVTVDPEVIETLRARIGDSERGIRSIAIRGLGTLRARPAVPDLLQVVREDRDDGLRFEGVRSLRKIGDAAIAGDLLALLNINNDDVRNESIATIGSMRYGGALAELTRIVESATKTDMSRVLALGALADLGDPASAPLFERLKNDRDEALRLYANEGIARTANPDMKTQISAARLVEKSARVRMAQAFALLRLGDSEYLDELVRGLDRRQTRDLAKEYLLETQGANRRALFAPRTASPAARAELADVMGMMGDPEALPTLRSMAQDADKDVARAAARAARRITTASGSQ
ncbi:MAG TPA: HEAT repeat domain-containing protein [Vicinamibacterales bacterium]|nr:HEAT repeat domain-containing protein [Vicinamibacterales bacterium]